MAPSHMSLSPEESAAQQRLAAIQERKAAREATRAAKVAQSKHAKAAKQAKAAKGAAARAAAKQALAAAKQALAAARQALALETIAATSVGALGVDELSAVFAALLEPADLGRAACVSRLWRLATRDELPWRTLALRHHPWLPPALDWRALTLARLRERAAMLRAPVTTRIPAVTS